MSYYLVWVRSQKYHGQKPLTYSFAGDLLPGTIVRVELQQEQILGFVERAVVRPSFATKPINQVLPLPPLPTQTIQLARWLQQFYATSLGVATQQVLPATLTKKAVQNIDTSLHPLKPVKLPPLTDEQSAVVKKIHSANTYLLHGVTGSGKTRVYIDVTIATLAAKKSAIILTPEISLTSQLARSFRAVFGERVVLLHSQLSPADRQIAWLRILTAAEPIVVIGPRSALFSPLMHTGLIIVDEAHESAYKQEQAPYYHATRVASQLALLHKASLILGSATPSVNDYYYAQQRQKPILRLTELATKLGHDPTKVTVIDLKDRSEFSRSRQLSTALLTSVQASLGRGEQSLIYLNRRGTARVVLCEQCGWQATCPHCDLPLVYHADSGRFRCHTCGHHEPLRASCPTCGHPSILFKSFGTKAILEEVQRLFPEARIQRFDTDNLQSERFEQHYEAIRRGDVDILVGTQLLAKGLDLPKLSTLGIVLAESSLYLPDFSASERTFQLLSQVLGRVGRGHVPGRAIVQTYEPQSPLLAAAIGNDWDSFYSTELRERRKFQFPPFYHLLKLSCRRASSKAAETATAKLQQIIISKVTDIEVDGPIPSFHEKLQGKYQYQLVVKATHRVKLLEIVQLLPSGWTYDIDPVNLL